MKSLRRGIVTMAVLAAIMALSAPAFAAEDADTNLECTYLSGTNINYQSYSRWSSTVDSYLTTSGDQYMRIEAKASEDGIVAVYYDKNFKLIKRQVISKELPIFGGFYETDSNYFIISGQTNENEDNNVEVIRITKYDKNWNKLGSCGVFGENTYNPFEAGSCRVDVSGSKMVVHTCHKMYTSAKDGLRHQANLTILMDYQQMQILDVRSGVSNSSTGYVSHSFNQFVRIDENSLVTVDHGDAYPRAFALIKYGTGLTSVSDYGCNLTEVMTFPGETGQNATGASVGGFEVSSTSYLIAGNSVVQDDNNLSRSTRNIFVAAVDKETSAVNINWITNLSEGETTTATPHLVQIGSDAYMLLWSSNGMVYYTKLDAGGQRTSGIFSVEGALSECAPIVDNGAVIWYTWNNGEEKFYQIPVSDPGSVKVSEAVYGHDYKWIKTENGLATMRCTKCGDEYTAKVPTSFYTYWRDITWEDTYYYSGMPLGVEAGGTVAYMISDLDYSAESEKSLAGFTVEAEPAEDCVVNAQNRRITFNEAGTYKITVYPTYNPDLKKQYTIRIVKPLTGVELTTDPASPQEIGSTVQLSAAADGGKGTLKYTFVQIDAQNQETELATNQTASTCEWTPEKAGTYKVRVDVTDPKDDNKLVSSEPVTFVFSKKAHPLVMPPAELNVPNTSDKITNDFLAQTQDWAFAAGDLNRPLVVGETTTATAEYIGADAYNYETVTASVKITRSACAHEKTRVVGGTAADCENTGFSGDVYCDNCNELLESGHVLEALGHDWQEPVYEWAKDNSKVTAKRVCNRDKEHVEVETAAAVGEVTKAPTYTTRGKTTYTVVFENAAFTMQTKTVSDIPKLEKLANTMTVKANKINAKANKKTVVKAAKAFAVTDAQGKVTYKKLKGDKKISVSNTGKVTVKKGLKKKTYKVIVKVAAAGTDEYAPKTVNVTLKVQVK